MGLSDTPEGWTNYIVQLNELSLSRQEQEREGWSGLSRGWAIGTAAGLPASARDRAHLKLSPAIDATQARELKQARWAMRLAELMAEVNRTVAEASAALKSAEWKIVLATRLRQEEGASVSWIAEALHMGKPSAVRAYLCRSGVALTNQQKAT